MMQESLLFPGAADLPCNDRIVKIECSIDDMSAELMGALLERLFAAGALDVNYQSIFMKKNRPAYQLNVICRPEDTADLSRLILTESTAIGLRFGLMQRWIMQRQPAVFASSLGQVQVKCCTLPPELGEESFVYPEYESLRKLAEEHHLTLKEVDARIRGEIYERGCAD